MKVAFLKYDFSHNSQNCLTYDLVLCYMKALPEIAYYGNGKITQYSIYNLGESVTQLDDELMKLQYDNAVLLTSVSSMNGIQTVALICSIWNSRYSCVQKV